MKVKECMCNDVYSCTPDCTIEDVAKMMGEKHVGCIPVCDNKNSIVGLITDRDIVLRGVACNKDLKQTPVSDIMSCNICSCSPEEEMSNVESKMAQNQVRRMPVVDNGKVIGILTMGDLAHFDNDLGKEEVCNTINSICDCNEENKNSQ